MFLFSFEIIDCMSGSNVYKKSSFLSKIRKISFFFDLRIVAFLQPLEIAAYCIGIFA